MEGEEKVRKTKLQQKARWAKGAERVELAKQARKVRWAEAAKKEAEAGEPLVGSLLQH